MNVSPLNPNDDRAPLIPYEHAETLRRLFEKKRFDKEGPRFITGENICIDGGMTKLMIYHGEHGWTYA